MKTTMLIVVALLAALASGAFAQESQPANTLPNGYNLTAQDRAVIAELANNEREDAEFEERLATRNAISWVALIVLVIVALLFIGWLYASALVKTRAVETAARERRPERPRPQGIIFACNLPGAGNQSPPAASPPPAPNPPVASPVVPSPPTVTATTTVRPAQPLAPLRDDADPSEIKAHGDLLFAQTGATSFDAPGIRITAHGAPLVPDGKILRDAHGAWTIQFPRGIPRDLDNRRKAAEEYWQSKQPVATTATGTATI